MSKFFIDRPIFAWVLAIVLMMFGSLIIFFLIVEPAGLNRLWRNFRSYFRVGPFAY